eukprot:CAMPEP_0176492252 /NCGR_PEP_ID=MMETSP0200_2-20121128/8887_1 /TAXON_ID=947934 /ORGANISM="Chaetoceros sp., Strain GSL56" /LENGTH=408 /DNA_ID=CAMNT_0017889777 /DNA_START=53 /DNA_END=1279 /DNA_ORIENTATION=-
MSSTRRHLTDRMEEVDNNQEHKKQPAQNDHRSNHRGGTTAYSVAAFDQNITSRQLLDQAVVEPNTHYEKTKHASSASSSSSQQPMNSSSASYHASSLVVLNQTPPDGVQHGGDNSNGNPRGVGATKKLDRILANRRSARRSRERRKQLQDNLEKSIFLLTKQNQVLSRENNELKQELGHLIQMYNKISLDVLANLEKNNVNSSLNQHTTTTTTTRAMIPSPMTCLPPNINNVVTSSSSSLQELLLYMAALSNNGNKGAGVNGIGTSSVLAPLNATTVNGLNTAASSASSMAPLPTNNTFPMSNLYTNNIHNAQLNGIGIGSLGGSTVGLGGNHIPTTDLVNSTANFAYTGGSHTDPSSSFLSSLPYYNDTATTGSQMMMNPLRVLHSGQQAFAGSFNGGATNNNLRQF